MNYDSINKLFDEGANIDEIIEAARKVNTQREAAAKAAKTQQAKDLANAREECVDAAKIYLMLAFDAAEVDTTENEDKIDKAAEEMVDALDELVQNVKGLYGLLDRLKDLRDKLEGDSDNDTDDEDDDYSNSEDDNDDDEDDDVLTRFINYLRSR